MSVDSSLTIRETVFGKGKPKICVPVVGVNQEQILEQIDDALNVGADLIEWRADFFHQVKRLSMLEDTLRQIREKIDDVPLLFTIRTKSEGGEIPVDKQTYQTLCNTAIESRLVDIVDIELFIDTQVRDELVQNAHDNRVKVIMSNHNFHRTPYREEMEQRLTKMAQNKADIVKIAVMPENTDDVMNLLNAIHSMSKVLEVPVVGISMGELGVVSRYCGELIGSAITFGVAKKSSAPGQISVSKLKEIL